MSSSFAACFVSHSASSTMSSIAAYCASLAHSKLRSAAHESGSRDNLSLHRWVLLKNSITTQDVHDDVYSSDSDSTSNTHSSSSSSSSQSTSTDHPESEKVQTVSSQVVQSYPTTVVAADVGEDDEDEEVDSIFDEYVPAYLFPDPGYAYAVAAVVPETDFASEDQWFDSLLETLGDEDDEDEEAVVVNNSQQVVVVTAPAPPAVNDYNNSVQVHIVPIDDGEDGNSDEQPTYSRSEPESTSLSSSYSDEYVVPSPSSSPLTTSSPISSSSTATTTTSSSVPYPVSYPLLRRPFDIDSHDFCCSLHSPSSRSDSPSYLPPYFHTRPYTAFEPSDGMLLNDSEEGEEEEPVPDAIEDTSDDESEAQSLSTPFSRSRSSLSLVDPASIPLPRDRFEPQIYYSASDEFFATATSNTTTATTTTTTTSTAVIPYKTVTYNLHPEPISTPLYSPYHQSC